VFNGSVKTSSTPPRRYAVSDRDDRPTPRSSPRHCGYVCHKIQPRPDIRWRPGLLYCVLWESQG
jgi:hypothetical protein